MLLLSFWLMGNDCIPSLSLLLIGEFPLYSGHESNLHFWQVEYWMCVCVWGLKRQTRAGSLTEAGNKHGGGGGASVKYIWIQVIQCLRVVSGKAQMYIQTRKGAELGSEKATTVHPLISVNINPHNTTVQVWKRTRLEGSRVWAFIGCHSEQDSVYFYACSHTTSNRYFRRRSNSFKSPSSKSLLVCLKGQLTLSIKHLRFPHVSPP